MKRKEPHFPPLLPTSPPATSSIQDAFGILLQSTEQVYILVDTDFKIRLFNTLAYNQAIRMSGTLLEIGRSVLDLVPPEQVHALKQLYQRVFAGEKIVQEKKYLIEGKIQYYTLKFVGARDEKGQIVGALVTAEDITETKLKQQALEMSEERWRFALEGSNQGMWDWNVLNGDVYFSAYWKKLFGYNNDNCIRHIDEWRNRIHPQDQAQVANNLANHFESHNPHFESVYRFKAQDGAYRWLLARGMVLDKDDAGNPVRMIGTHTDITDMRLLEESYKTLFDANPLPSWTYCLDSGSFMDVNEAALKLYGYTRAEFLSMTITDLGVPDELDLTEEVLHLRGKHYRQHRKKNGDIIIVNITGDIIQKNNRTLALVMAEDVTQKVAAEKQLQQSEKQYRTLFHSNPLPAWIYEKATGKMLAVNHAAIAHYGYTKEEFLALTPFDITPKEQHTQLRQRIANEQKEENIFEKEWKHQKKNGEVIYVDLNSAAISYNGIDSRLVVVHDVTAMVHTKQQLQISNHRFELATKAASEALWEWDIENNTVYISPVYEQMFGFEIDLSQKYKEWHDYIHPEDSPRVISSFYSAIDNPSLNQWVQEYRYLKADGSFVHVVDHCLIIRNEKGQATKAVGAIQDITKRKEVENAIKESNERFELASRATSDALYDWNMVSNELKWSEGLFELFGHPPQTVTIKNWESFIHPSEQEEVLQSLQVATGNPAESTWKKEYRFQNANGEYKYVFEKGFIVRNDEGKPIRMIGALQDITDIKQKQIELAESNERFDTVLKATSDFIWDWNLETDYCYRDKKGMKAVLGVEDEKSIDSFEKMLKRLHPEDVRGAQDVINSVLRNNDKNNFEFEYRFRRDDGHYAYIFDRAIVIRNEAKKPVRIIGAAQDITPRKKLEQKLLQKELEKQKIISKATIDTQEQERTEIGRELHDNVNQVLTTTKLYLELSQASPEMKEDMIQKASNNIVYVINEIRQLSRSLMNPSIDDLGLMDAIKDLIDSINATKKLFIKLKMSPQIESLLTPDAKLMVYRILQEALNNAVKHSQASNVLIHIKKKEKNIEVIVKDNGIGFNIASAKKGVGLKNIQNRVYLVNGKLKIESTPGNGCTLNIYFPFKNNEPI